MAEEREEPGRPGIRDLALRAASDPDFALMLVKEPDKVIKHYNISPEQASKIKDLANRSLAEVAALAVRPRPAGGGGGGY